MVTPWQPRSVKTRQMTQMMKKDDKHVETCWNHRLLIFTKEISSHPKITKVLPPKCPSEGSKGLTNRAQGTRDLLVLTLLSGGWFCLIEGFDMF